MMIATGVDRDVGLNGGDLVLLGGADGVGGPESLGVAQRQLVQIDRDDLGSASALAHRDDQGTDGSSADHQHGLVANVPGSRHGVPGDRGGLDESSGPEIEGGGQRTQHPGRQRHVADERAIGVGKARSAAEVGAQRRQIGPTGGISRDAVVDR